MTLTRKLNYKNKIYQNHKSRNTSRKVRGGSSRFSNYVKGVFKQKSGQPSSSSSSGPLVPGPLVPGPLVPGPLVPGPAPGLVVSFSDTQILNPILNTGRPIPPPFVTTDIGGRILAIIELTQNDVASGAVQADDPIFISTIKLLEQMLDYPESSNLENYIILNENFLTGAEINRLMPILNNVLQEKKSKELSSRVGISGAFNLNTLVNMPGEVPVNDKISSRNLLSLMILSSRLCPKYSLRSNPEANLFNSLNTLFDNGNGATFNSNNISGEIENFIRTNSAVTVNYILNLINGKTIYAIYTANYMVKGREISQDLITSRLNKWLKPQNLVRYEIPIVYLFNKYTNSEKARINKDAEICKIVSDFTDIINKPTTQVSLLPPSVFNIEQNDNVDFSKINEFMKSIAPAAIKKEKLPKNKSKRKK
jgi:hypothetical protein